MGSSWSEAAQSVLTMINQSQHRTHQSAAYTVGLSDLQFSKGFTEVVLVARVDDVEQEVSLDE